MILVEHVKKRNLKDICCLFNKEWTDKYFYGFGNKSACLICQDSVAVLKK